MGNNPLDVLGLVLGIISFGATMLGIGLAIGLAL